MNLLAKSVFTHHLNFEELRYLGVMQRLAIGYGVTSLVAITVKHKYFPAIILVTLAVYFLLLAMGDGFNLSATNIVARLMYGHWVHPTCTMMVEWRLIRKDY